MGKEIFIGISIFTFCSANLISYIKSVLKSSDLFILKFNFLKERLASIFNAFAPISTFVPSVSSKIPPSSAITLKSFSSSIRSSSKFSSLSPLSGKICGVTPHPIKEVNIHKTRNNEITFFHIINTSFLYL